MLVAEVVRVLARGRGGHEMTAIGGSASSRGCPSRCPRSMSAGSRPRGGRPAAARTPYVGRARRARQCSPAASPPRDGTGGLVLIAGEPGIGKTRLADEVCAQFDDIVGVVRRLSRRRCRRRTHRSPKRSPTGRGARPPRNVREGTRRRRRGRRAARTRRSARSCPTSASRCRCRPTPRPRGLHDAVGQVLTRLARDVAGRARWSTICTGPTTRRSACCRARLAARDADPTSP